MALSNSPERWRQAEALFHQAMNCDPAQRTDFLADACGNDQALRTEVESLLAGSIIAKLK